ncbi:MAG TPA: DUF6529 family protein [Ktedonobacterales bacterium]
MASSPMAGRPHQHRTLGAWRLLPVAVVIVSTAAEVSLALGWVFWPASTPTYSFGFSDFTHMKIWFASVALALAILQLFWAARIYQLIRFPPNGRFYNVLHRWSGRVALLLTLPVAYHCIIIAGQVPRDNRVLAHMAFGAFFYGAVVAKILIVRRPGLAGWLTPIAGGLLFVLLLGLWLTSVPWFVQVYGLSL